MRFLLDSNFLMIPGMFRVDVFGLLKNFEKPELYTIDLVLDELKSLSLKKGKSSKYAKNALFSVKTEGVKVLPYGKKVHADRAILDVAGKGFVVCTQDKALIKKLKKKKLRAVTLRQKRYLRLV